MYTEFISWKNCRSELSFPEFFVCGWIVGWLADSVQSPKYFYCRIVKSNWRANNASDAQTCTRCPFGAALPELWPKFQSKSLQGLQLIRGNAILKVCLLEYFGLLNTISTEKRLGCSVRYTRNLVLTMNEYIVE